MSNKEKNKQPADNVETAVVKSQYHFSGEMIYWPLTVEADSQAEALKIWEEKRKLIKLTK